jgi:NhaA family Na+:H+ antiporter
MVGGAVLALALAAALIWSNADPHGYVTWWATRLGGLHVVSGSLTSASDGVDNGLMTLFFLAIGLELGREVADGSLRDRRNALLPVVAALGGMAGAAGVYLLTSALLHPHTSIAKGWGIPMATDVAFTLGAVALLGRRVPRPLRTFLLALAVADDVASVVVLALVASTHIHLLWLGGAALSLVAVALLHVRVRHAWWPYLLALVAVWYLCTRAGVEPTLAGAFVGMLVPAAAWSGSRITGSRITGSRIPSRVTADRVGGPSRPFAGRVLEVPVHAVSSYVVLPLFVLANAGVQLTGSAWHAGSGADVIVAIVTARIVGKALGITLVVLLLTRLGLCRLPERTTWRHMIGISLLCGMGLTVPLLFAHALFGHSLTLFTGAQVGLLLGTLAAAVLGSLVLLVGPKAAAAAALPADPAPANSPGDPGSRYGPGGETRDIRTPAPESHAPESHDIQTRDIQTRDEDGHHADATDRAAEDRAPRDAGRYGWGLLLGPGCRRVGSRRLRLPRGVHHG